MRYKLPREPEILSRAITEMRTRSCTVVCPRKIEWKINYLYLQGLRDFHIVSYRSGRVDATWESNQGQLKFRFEDILELYNRELGQYLGMDVRPVVKPRKILDLDGHRKSAIAQVYLDHVTAPLDLETIHLHLAEGLLQFGTMGLAAFTDNDVSLEEGVYLKTIPPWQLYSVPGTVTRASDVMGIMRERWVPWAELREQKGAKRLKFPRKDGVGQLSDKLEPYYVPVGEKAPETDGDPNEYTSSDIQLSLDPSVDTTRGGPRDRSQPYVRVTETWLFDHRGRVDRYIVMVGRYIAADDTFDDLSAKPCFPIGIARASHAGGFYARPWLSPLVPINHETELMYTQLFKNIQELDQFGFALYPNDIGIKQHHFQSTTRPRAIPYEQDGFGTPPVFHQFRPFNTGDFPGKVAATGLQLADRIGKNSPLLQGQSPGRQSSGVGLGVLWETMAVARKAAATSIRTAYRQVYRCLLSKGKTADLNTLQLSTVDHAVAGVVIDQSTGRIDLSSNPMPDVDEVRLDIRQAQPRLISQLKQELVLMKDKGQIDNHGFSWKNHTEDLGFPLDDMTEVLQREMCMWRNIVQFNDGVTPVTAEHVLANKFDLHEIHIRCIQEFMSYIVYRLASPAVRQAIEDRLAVHQAALGRFPDEMPFPEDLAASMPPIAPGQMPPGVTREIERLKKRAQTSQVGDMLSQLKQVLPQQQGAAPPGVPA